MSTEAAAAKRLRLAVDHIQEAGISDCLVVFEGHDSRDKVRPFAMCIGSPSACLEFARFAVERLENERDCTVYGIDDETGEEHEM